MILEIKVDVRVRAPPPDCSGAYELNFDIFPDERRVTEALTVSA